MKAHPDHADEIDRNGGMIKTIENGKYWIWGLLKIKTGRE